MGASLWRSNLKVIRKKNNITQAQLALQLNTTQQTIGNWESGTSSPNIDDLTSITKIFGITTDQFLTSDLSKVQGNTNLVGNGKGTKSTAKRTGNDTGNDILTVTKQEKIQLNYPTVITIDSQGEENTLYVPVKARAGYLAGFNDREYIEKLPAYRLPGYNNGTYRIFEVEGHSMFNTFHDKDKAICRWESLANIKDGRVYVLVTQNDGILCKRVINRYSEGVLICNSDNNHKGEYPPIILDVHEVREVWYVTDRWTKQLPPPGELYKRLIDVEAEVVLMKESLRRLTANRK